MSAPAPNNVDIDALLDLSEYDNNYNSSPSLSPSTASKPTFASPVMATVTPSVPSSAPQTLSGPSHNYDLYRQQTGFVPGAIANTMAVNQSNNTGYQDFSNFEYFSGLTPEDDVFDFNASPSQGNMDVDFESSAESHHFLGTVNPNSIEQGSSSVASPAVSSTSSSVGRLWPGAHSQAALAKAQAQQRQQQHIVQQPPLQRRSLHQSKSRGKTNQPADPIVEQKITQLLSSMRAKPSVSESQGHAVGNLSRSRKEEEDMDEDERLLASEEGKKLSSKERRQLRNKVSARAFRSRRKEYISQLESEIANKVNENGELRTQNRALLEENKRLSDLTRMLLSSSSFSSFLDNLSTNPSAHPQPSQIKVEAQQQHQAHDQGQTSKDVNPYSSQNSQQQQIGMAMVPEQTMDISLLSLGSTPYNFQPQVFVVDTPEIAPIIDASVLSGKASTFVEESLHFEEDKVNAPVIERPTDSPSSCQAVEEKPADDSFESDPEFALYHFESCRSRPESQAVDDIFDGVQTDKAVARYELVDTTEEEEMTAAFVMRRVQRMSANMESVVSRLEILTRDL